jgi:hypothetical protein
MDKAHPPTIDNDAPPFALEPSVPDGNTPERVIEELCAARTTARDYAEAYNAAIVGQAEKYKLQPSALKRFVNAKEVDALEKLDEETTDLEKLIGQP